jgi:hypothetical protein
MVDISVAQVVDLSEGYALPKLMTLLAQALCSVSGQGLGCWNMSLLQVLQSSCAGATLGALSMKPSELSCTFVLRSLVGHMLAFYCVRESAALVMLSLAEISKDGMLDSNAGPTAGRDFMIVQ